MTVAWVHCRDRLGWRAKFRQYLHQATTHEIVAYGEIKQSREAGVTESGSHDAKGMIKSHGWMNSNFAGISVLFGKGPWHDASAVGHE